MASAGTDSLSGQLRELLGEELFVKLCQEHGGTRVYVPNFPEAEHGLVETIGMAAARKMADAFGASALRIPLARVDRALHYRAQGMSSAKIARKLGITENGVLRLFKRVAE